MLEWCIGTMPIGEYLVGSDRDSGAHRRYRPEDFSNKECREKASRAAKRKHEIGDVTATANETLLKA